MIYRVLKKIEWMFLSIYNVLIFSYLLPLYLKNKKQIKKITPLHIQVDKNDCYIVLGGLSASELDFSKLCNEDVFTVNHFFRNEIWDFIKPKYHIVTDNNFFKKSKNTNDLYNKCGDDVQLFLNGRYLKDQRKNIFPIFPVYKYSGSIKWKPLDKPQIYFSTVTLQSIYIAVILGYKKINLVGFDLPPGHMPHFYKDSDIEIEGEKIQQAKVDEYAYCSLFWQYTNCHHEAYGLARFCKKNNVKVFNMSDSSFVRAFEYKEYNLD
jgi:hypothetical protein